MRRTPLFLFVFIYFINVQTSAQSGTQWPKTFHWRISGNGLTKPSFLFGTIHLQDKRVFNFGDSLFRSIEQAEGFAIEIDMREFMDSVFQKALNDGEDQMLEKYFRKSSNKEKIIDSLIENVDKYNDKASKKKLQSLRREKMRKALKNQEMPTFMDGYLFGVARRLGKWTGGIEDVQDQLPLMDEFGKKITREELLAPDTELKKSLEEMIQIYLAQDISRIEQYCKTDLDEHGEDIVLTRRNIKMAYRMDSLARIRTMFFAVGAAHLGGEKGVIRLLKEKGFKVEPVFSVTKVDPVQYAAKLENLPWEKVSDKENTYSIEMPGQPSDVKMFGSINMKLHVDITTLSYYMAGSIPAQKNVDLNNAIKAMSKNSEVSVSNVRNFEENGVKGVEGIFSNDQYYYKFQYRHKGNFLYMLMVGGEKKEILESKDARRFFESFTAKEKVIKPQNDWQLFQIEDKAFKILTPAIPKRNMSIDRNTEKTEWLVQSYDCLDTLPGTYYLVQIKDLSSGYYLTGDTAYFNVIKNTLVSKLDSLTLCEVDTWKSFPAMRLEGLMSNGQLHCRTLTINRGNRIYTLMAVGDLNMNSNGGPERFFNSFDITDYKNAEWKAYRGPNFSTTAPASIKSSQSSEEDKETQVDISEEELKNEKSRTIQYTSYNPNDAISYYVSKKPLGAYFWVKDDSTLYETYRQLYLANDSILSKKVITNGSVKGVEFVTQMPDNNLRKKMRFLVHGDSLYFVYSFIPSQSLGQPVYSRFFEDFRFDDETIKSSVFENKNPTLMNDLLSKDSAKFVKASESLNDAVFTTQDIPLLVDGLTKNYLSDQREDIYFEPRNIIQSVLQPIADSSMVTLIAKRFPEIKGDYEHVKIDMLNTLSGYHTAYSYKIFKNLLLKHTPGKILSSQYFTYKLNDSLALSVGLYPEILSLSRDTIVGLRIWELTHELLDSNLIKPEMVLPYKSDLLATADRLITEARDTVNFFSYHYLDVITMLAWFKDEICNKKLQQILMLKDLDCKQEAILGLLKNGLSVPASEINTIATDKNYRVSFYKELKKIGKNNLFPAKYLNQRSISEADIYVQAYDEDEPSSIVYLGERTAVYKNVKSKFYLYKVTFKYGEEGEESEYSYFGVSGPFSLNQKECLPIESISGLYDEELEDFSAKKIETYLKAFLKERE